MHPEIHFIAAAKKARKLLNVESHQFQLLDRVFKLSIDLQTLSENSYIGDVVYITGAVVT